MICIQLEVEETRESSRSSAVPFSDLPSSAAKAAAEPASAAKLDEAEPAPQLELLEVHNPVNQPFD